MKETGAKRRWRKALRQFIIMHPIRLPGTSMTASQPIICRACGTPAPADFTFCGKCGRRLRGDDAAGPTPRRFRAAFLAAAIAVVLVAVALARRSSSAVPEAEPGPAAAAPVTMPTDISRLSPAERFDRLYRRVMQGARTGDTLATRFAPMALAAFEMLDTVDADTRYHAALIKLHLGDAAGAAAFGDSILARDSSHLLGWVARGMALRWQRDTARLPAVYAGFRRHAAAELARGRPEYAEHQMILGEFRQAAEGGKAAP
jgi:hypothetical protein